MIYHASKSCTSACLEDHFAEDAEDIPGTLLVPCPFCGKRRAYYDGDAVFAAVRCEECGARGPSVSTMREAADAWNERR